MKILHSADWHLGAPLQGRTEEQADWIRQEMLAVPGRIAGICREQGCDLMLLAGDLLDGACAAQVIQAIRNGLEEAAVPVFIAPGNHDFVSGQSPWITESFPENVHIFTANTVDSVALPELDCRVYGGAFTAPDCRGLLEGFTARGAERYQIGVFHGDPTSVNSPYCPVSGSQVMDSGLDYLALGHIHKQGSILCGDTLCAWPGCPMGHGFDETEEKGVLIVTVKEKADARFLPLEGVRFYDWEAPVTGSAESTLSSLLPPVESRDFYRITLTGECAKPDLPYLKSRFSRFPNLEIRDRTVLPVDPWASVGEDSFEGAYFTRLQQAMEGQDEDTRRAVALAAKLSRQILDGMEVTLP